MSGPLDGIRVAEFASIGPGPFAAMMLADMGATVIRVERPGAALDRADPLLRGRAASLVVDLKKRDGVDVALRLSDSADVLLEGLRPGVMERLGLGPVECRERNPRLVYGRMTGWGQSGLRAREAGHDIDYLAVAGSLHPIGGPDSPPPPPLNLVADFGGGAMMLVAGVLAALVERQSSGLGSVIDAAMSDGAALLASMMHGMLAAGTWTDERSANLLDGGAPFYRCYETADGRFMAVGALEPVFYGALLAGLGLAPDDLPDQYDRSGWPVLHDRFAEVFATRSQAEWEAAFAGSDACVAPVRSLSESHHDEHMRSRGSFIDVGGATQPAPAPRFDRFPAGSPSPPRRPGSDTRRVLEDLGYDDSKIEALLAAGVVAADSAR